MTGDSTHADDFTGWIPAQLIPVPAVGRVDWVHLGEARFSDPFFEETLRRARHSSRRTTSFDALLEWAARSPGLEPRGFIFHASRCGSTYLARALSALDDTVVLSEPTPIDTVLRVRDGGLAIPDDVRTAWLRATLSALGQPRRSGDRRLFVKFDSWAVFDLPFIRRVYPEVPWTFLYRDPLEILVSQARTPGMHMLPGGLPPALFGMAWNDLASLPAEEYRGRVLGRVFEAGLEAMQTVPGGLLLDYRQLPSAAWTELAAHFGLALDERGLAALRATAIHHAKRPTQVFSPDADEKRAEITEDLRSSARRHVLPVYERLEARRR